MKGTGAIYQITATTEAEARKKAEKLARTLTGVGIFQVTHDDGCKALITERDCDCTPPCKPDFYLIHLAPDATVRAA